MHRSLRAMNGDECHFCPAASYPVAFTIIQIYCHNHGEFDIAGAVTLFGFLTECSIRRQNWDHIHLPLPQHTAKAASAKLPITTRPIKLIFSSSIGRPATAVFRTKPTYLGILGWTRSLRRLNQAIGIGIFERISANSIRKLGIQLLHLLLRLGGATGNSLEDVGKGLVERALQFSQGIDNDVADDGNFGENVGFADEEVEELLF